MKFQNVNKNMYACTKEYSDKRPSGLFVVDHKTLLQILSSGCEKLVVKTDKEGIVIAECEYVIDNVIHKFHFTRLTNINDEKEV